MGLAAVVVAVVVADAVAPHAFAPPAVSLAVPFDYTA